jgi:hypothetical protein
MIGNPNWFNKRLLNLGIRPKTWEGVVYLIFLILPIVIFQSISDFNNSTKIILTVVWILFVVIEIIDIMRKIDDSKIEQ